MIEDGMFYPVPNCDTQASSQSQTNSSAHSAHASSVSASPHKTESPSPSSMSSSLSDQQPQASTSYASQASHKETPKEGRRSVGENETSLHHQNGEESNVKPEPVEEVMEKQVAEDDVENKGSDCETMEIMCVDEKGHRPEKEHQTPSAESKGTDLSESGPVLQRCENTDTKLGMSDSAGHVTDRRENMQVDDEKPGLSSDHCSGHVTTDHSVTRPESDQKVSVSESQKEGNEITSLNNDSCQDERKCKDPHCVNSSQQLAAEPSSRGSDMASRAAPCTRTRSRTLSTDAATDSCRTSGHTAGETSKGSSRGEASMCRPALPYKGKGKSLRGKKKGLVKKSSNSSGIAEGSNAKGSASLVQDQSCQAVSEEIRESTKKAKDSPSKGPKKTSEDKPAISQQQQQQQNQQHSKSSQTTCTCSCHNKNAEPCGEKGSVATSSGSKADNRRTPGDKGAVCSAPSHGKDGEGECKVAEGERRHGEGPKQKVSQRRHQPAASGESASIEVSAYINLYCHLLPYIKSEHDAQKVPIPITNLC